MSAILGNTLDMQKKSLEYLWKKQEVISQNIANAETPGYKAKYVSFEDTFKSRIEAAARRGGAEAINQAVNSSDYYVKTRVSESARLDGNGVNVDVQNVEMLRTALQYQTVIQSLNSDITRIRSVFK